ncbi:ASCH domain-containing protein [Candidatus Woesearchaeota archaeon]|nr:ASCH domain-containing protein [Candidatus Woesearchaeota archaeon]
MKTLKFKSNLSKQVLDGSKTTTWRLYDDKDLSVGDELSLVISETQKEFARARVTAVDENTLGKLSPNDWEGHEKFSSTQRMYETYKHYYNRTVNEKTIVKIIKFRLLT